MPQDPPRTVRVRNRPHLLGREDDMSRLNEFLEGFDLGRPDDRSRDGLVR